MSAMKTIEGFITNEEGNLYMNQSAIADVCGVSRQAISKRLSNTCKPNTAKGIQGMDNSVNLVVIDKVGTLVPEEVVIEFVDYYAVNYLRSFALLGFRQATYNALGYELPKLEVNPIKTFPKYERTVSDWLEDRFKKDYKLIEREFRLPSNCRADFLLNNRIIVEVKRIENWKLAVGQVLSYKIELQKLGCKNISTQVELFGTIDTAEQEELREDINKMGVNKVGFITDINLIYDRR